VQRIAVLIPGDIDRGSSPRYRSTGYQPGQFLTSPPLPCAPQLDVIHCPRRKRLFSSRLVANRPAISRSFLVRSKATRMESPSNCDTHYSVHSFITRPSISGYEFTCAGIIARMIDDSSEHCTVRLGMTRVNYDATIFSAVLQLFAMNNVHFSFVEKS